MSWRPPRLPLNPLLIFSPIATGLVVGVGASGIAIGTTVLALSSDDKALFGGACILAGGLIFFGYTVFGVFWLRRSAGRQPSEKS